MLITVLRAMPIIKYVIVEQTLFIDLTPMMPLKKTYFTAFKLVDGKIRENFLCFDLSKINPADLQDIENYGVIDLWIIADKIDELFTDEFERQRFHESMARLHVF
ncbi:hypothetical protein RMR21_009675 [Agrobacterium sp. rho-8.1]|nr:hypothetical protein [Agrobacterium sp. rho-8.1]